MRLEGSCHCQAVTFSIESRHPYPFNLCYCSICRKTAGGGGFAINLGGNADTLEVSGREHVTIYQAMRPDTETGELKQSDARRHFCSLCGSSLWVWDTNCPELLHPFASAIDTDLPKAPEQTHLMLDSKADWVQPCIAGNDQSFPEYPAESLAQWHQRLDLEK